MSRRKNRRNRKPSFNRLLNNVSNNNRFYDVVAKTDYTVAGYHSKTIFLRNMSYKSLQLNENFFRITSPLNNKSVIITIDLFNKIFN